MSEPARKAERRFTWADYQTWPDDERWEIVDGAAYAMSPSPTFRHQSILREIAGPMIAFFKGRKCQLMLSPLDVKLSEEDVVQPDLLVVCNSSQIKRAHVEGPPALVVEILSPSSTVHDRLRKTQLYARSGVKEFWLVTPYPSLVEVLLLKGRTYRIEAAYAKEDTLISPSFPGLRIKLADVFNFPLEPGEETPVVREPPAQYRAGRR